MQIFVDADVCLVVGIVEAIAEKYNIPGIQRDDSWFGKAELFRII